jgi:hypothetical protein
VPDVRDPALAAPPKKAAEPPAAAAAPAGDAENEGPGTTIFGEQESPIGLYITPWKNANAERGMDRPARFLDEEMLPVDRETFHRQIEYYDTIAAYRRAQLGKKP